jgi:hypothetical protein
VFVTFAARRFRLFALLASRLGFGSARDSRVDRVGLLNDTAALPAGNQRERTKSSSGALGRRAGDDEVLPPRI